MQRGLWEAASPWLTGAVLQAAGFPVPSRSVLFLESSPAIKKIATPITFSLLGQQTGAKRSFCRSFLKADTCQVCFPERPVSSLARAEYAWMAAPSLPSHNKALLQNTDQKFGS